MKPILLVEDDDNDVLFLQHSFAKAGVNTPVHRVACGQEAIDYLAGTGAFADRDKYPLPSLVLLDLNLPRKTGFDVLEWARATPHLTGMVVIVLTSARRSRCRPRLSFARQFLHRETVATPGTRPIRLAALRLLAALEPGASCAAVQTLIPNRSRERASCR